MSWRKFDAIRGEVTISNSKMGRNYDLIQEKYAVQRIIRSKRDDVRDKPSTYFRSDRSKLLIPRPSNPIIKHDRIDLLDGSRFTRDQVLQRYLAAGPFDILINNYLINFRLGIPSRFIASPEFIP